MVDGQDIRRNEIEVWHRCVGDREPLGAVLTDQNDAPLDLSGAAAVAFRLVNLTTGVAVVEGAAATVEDPEAGEVSYEPQAGDVAVAGQFAVYFLATWPGLQPVRFPYDGARWLLEIKPETQTE